ncbi:MAG: hypothetical protein ACKO6C_00240 [Alphaproteobacteria bacterium]
MILVFPADDVPNKSTIGAGVEVLDLSIESRIRLRISGLISYDLLYSDIIASSETDRLIILSAISFLISVGNFGSVGII